MAEYGNRGVKLADMQNAVAIILRDATREARERLAETFRDACAAADDATVAVWLFDQVEDSLLEELAQLNEGGRA